MANPKPATPTIVDIPEEEEDLEFLCQIEAAEAQALSLSASSSKRRRISIVDDLQVKLERDNDFVEEIEEGAYTAALKGSKSLTWKRNQQLQSSKTLTKPYESSMNSGSGVGSGGGGGGACFKCGKEGHWARDCSQITSSVASAGPEVVGSTAAVVAEKACPCGLGICLVLTANTERNRGRKFYRCPVRQENGGCNFFEWCDISSGTYSSVGVQGEKAWKNGTHQPYYQHPSNQGSPAFTNSWNDYDKGTSSPGFSYGGIQKSDIAADTKGNGTRTGSTCFKCGEEGHWARDCPSSSPSDGLRGKASFDGGRGNPSSGACFKCGQSGHWARDCTQPQSTTVRNW